MAPKIGGNREIPAYFLLSVLLKLLSTCCGVAELSASAMICLIALLLKNKKLVCLLSCRQAYWIIDMIHSISKLYTPSRITKVTTHRWIFTQYQRYIHLWVARDSNPYSWIFTQYQRYIHRTDACHRCYNRWIFTQYQWYIHRDSQQYSSDCSWIFTQNQWCIHCVDWNVLNSNVISQKLSEFFECLDIDYNSI